MLNKTKILISRWFGLLLAGFIICYMFFGGSLPLSLTPNDRFVALALAILAISTLVMLGFLLVVAVALTYYVYLPKAKIWLLAQGIK